MDYGDGSYDHLFSSLTPEMAQDTWIGAGAQTVATQSATGGNCFGDIVNGDELQFLTSGTTDDPHPDIFTATDDEIDRVVQRMFERSAKDGPGDTVDMEGLPCRTPSPPEDLVYTEIHCPTTFESQITYGQDFRVPSPPIDSTPMHPYNYLPPQQQPQRLPSIECFSSSIAPGSHVGYVATTFAPTPVSMNTDLPLPFGFYTSMSMPREALLNASSFTGSLSASAAGLASRNTRNNKAKSKVIPEVITVDSVSDEPIPTPVATSTPKPVASKSFSYSSGSTAPKPFYQPTIRKLNEIRPPKGSIEERTPMIAALLKSQSQIFNNLNAPKPLILSSRNKAKQTRRQDARVNQMETPDPSRSSSVDASASPAVITLDENSDQEELIEEEEETPLATPNNNSDNSNNAVKNPAVIVFPNMRNFSVLGHCSKETPKSRTTLCAQSRTVIGRVLAYNMEVRKRMGTGYVGPWLSPVRLTSYMTGVSTTIVKQCEEFATKQLMGCTPERKRAIKASLTPLKNKRMDAESGSEARDAKRDLKVIRLVNKQAQLVTPVRPPAVVGSHSFDWASLYNGDAPPEIRRKRNHTFCGILREEHPSEQKKLRFSEDREHEARPENAAIMRILNGLPNGFSGKGQSEDPEVAKVVNELLDAVCRDEEKQRKAVEEEVDGIIQFASEIRNKMEDEGWQKGAEIQSKKITRLSSNAEAPLKVRRKPFVPTIADEPFKYHGRYLRSRDAYYNFRPRENIAKKRFTY